MIDQSNLFRADCFGSFLDLFKAVTIDPAMLQWLNGAENRKGAPNENYAREMMELFSLGADRGAYTEDDIREQARALTGWRNDWSSEHGAHNFRFDPKRHDTNNKTVFGQTGNWGWEDACRLCVENPLHPSFFVDKLWSYFVPQPPPASDARSADQHLRRLRLADPPGARGDPDSAPTSTKARRWSSRRSSSSPAMLRALGRYIDTDAWTWLCEPAGQVLFWPPNVSGWDDTRWLDTSRMRARWNIVDYVLDDDLRRRLGATPTAPPRPPTKRWPGRSPPGARRNCAPNTGPSCSTSPSARKN